MKERILLIISRKLTSSFFLFLVSILSLSLWQCPNEATAQEFESKELAPKNKETNNLIAQAVSNGGNKTSDYEKERQAYDACQRVNKLLGAGSYSEAAQLAQSGISCDPTAYSGYLHRQLSACLKAQKDFQGAIAELKKAAKLDPTYKNSTYDIALINYESGNLEEAIKGLEEAQKQPGADPILKQEASNLLTQVGAFGYLKLAERALAANNLSAAKKHLTSAARFDPSTYSSTVHGNLAYVLRELGESERAIEEGKKALNFQPNQSNQALPQNQANTVYTIGLAYQDLGNFQEAINWLTRYTQLETNAQNRQKAEVFIAELRDDLGKQKPGLDKKADYLESCMENGVVPSWPAAKMPLKVYIKSGTSQSGYKPIYRDFTIHALDTWCSVCPKLSYKLVDNPQSADISVSFSNSTLGMSENGRTRLKAGITDIKSDKAEILSAKVAVTTINPFDQKPVRDGECATITMHEIGHSLGLDHSTAVSDIMYFGSSCKQTGKPTARDRNTLALIYKDKPIITASLNKTVKPLNITYLPPPAFLPPAPVDTKALKPPVFLPPPLAKEVQYMKPPLFVPPPLKKELNSAQNNKAEPSLNRAQPAARDKSKLPFFLPPPK
ncbi:MAG: Tetratricopeptide repeat protein [bacterium ADurb.Bin425]|nr:MAG: Tetratricopeptide repeat protein [bacterium ADurb.Bin425]